jgi:CubicO group peptidase (beta-lactamase class C family)
MPFFAESLEDAQKGLFTMGALDEIYMTRAPAGDMYSNALDLTRWAKAVMDYGSVDGNQILNKESVQETLQPYSIMDGTELGGDYGPVHTYGLGWMMSTYKGRTVFSHGKRPSVFPFSDHTEAHSTQLNSTPQHSIDRWIDFWFPFAPGRLP